MQSKNKTTCRISCTSLACRPEESKHSYTKSVQAKDMQEINACKLEKDEGYDWIQIWVLAFMVVFLH